jgi:hypothetical protein
MMQRYSFRVTLGKDIQQETTSDLPDNQAAQREALAILSRTQFRARHRRKSPVANRGDGRGPETDFPSYASGGIVAMSGRACHHGGGASQSPPRLHATAVASILAVLVEAAQIGTLINLKNIAFCPEPDTAQKLSLDSADVRPLVADRIDQRGCPTLQGKTANLRRRSWRA